MVLWLIGMSGSGKTTLGKYIYGKLKPECKNLVFLDGDTIREIMGNDLGHSIEDRFKNSLRITKLCQQLSLQGINVICAVLSLFHEAQDWNRKNIKDYYEVYIQCALETLVKRDAKGIYKKALAGELKDVVGVDIDFPPPKQPNQVISNDAGLEALLKQGDDVISAIRVMMQ